jgi:UDP-N-acetylglucosamine--N-acetylmuramyl-(pentapeptide) pyrophosphoryl-undecaprenol N-acetylglucosamine transferase
MPDQFSKADLILCRAGATTLAEITVAGKAAILVPFPAATDNHQQRNAEALAKAGAVEMILQRDLAGDTLAARIEYYAHHPETLRLMAQNSLAQGRPDSTERIVDLLEELAHV